MEFIKFTAETRSSGVNLPMGPDQEGSFLNSIRDLVIKKRSIPTETEKK
jgi:high-affinity K+ transport system ATPase subunit B